MSKRLYVYFKPSAGSLSIEEMVKRINARFPEEAKIGDETDYADLNGKWSGYISRPYNSDNHPDFPYWRFYFWEYWNTILSCKEFRCYVMELCQTLGATEWWYIEEESEDLYEELSAEDFEKVLTDAVGIENFERPRYFPNSQHHFFKDSVLRVQSLMD